MKKGIFNGLLIVSVTLMFSLGFCLKVEAEAQSKYNTYQEQAAEYNELLESSKEAQEKDKKLRAEAMEEYKRQQEEQARLLKEYQEKQKEHSDEYDRQLKEGEKLKDLNMINVFKKYLKSVENVVDEIDRYIRK